MNHKKLLLQLLPAYMAILGLLFFYGFNRPKSSQSLTYISQGKNIDAYLWGKPVKISIPAIGISLKVEDGNYEETTKSWNVSNANVHFATVTHPPSNASGNTLIYGHNSNNVLGKTKNLKQGDRLFILTDNGLLFEYEMKGFKEVSPYDTKIFNYQGNPTVTLITCSGIADQKRRLMQFDFVKVH